MFLWKDCSVVTFPLMLSRYFHKPLLIPLHGLVERKIENLRICQRRSQDASLSSHPLLASCFINLPVLVKWPLNKSKTSSRSSKTPATTRSPITCSTDKETWRTVPPSKPFLTVSINSSVTIWNACVRFGAPILRSVPEFHCRLSQVFRSFFRFCLCLHFLGFTQRPSWSPPHVGSPCPWSTLQDHWSPWKDCRCCWQVNCLK